MDESEDKHKDKRRRKVADPAQYDKPKPGWTGPDRRKRERRGGQVRREEIRFEPEKQARRGGCDRREDRRSGWDRASTR